MKTFGGEQEESAGDAGLAWEQVKLDERGGDVLSGFSVGQNSSRRFLDILETIWGFAGNPRWDSVAVAQAGGYRGLVEGFSHMIQMRWMIRVWRSSVRLFFFIFMSIKRDFMRLPSQCRFPSLLLRPVI